jgi:hypothetical protein
MHKIKRIIKTFNINDGSEDPGMYASLAIQDWVEENEWIREKISTGDVELDMVRNPATLQLCYRIVLNATQEEHAYYMFTNE